MSYIMPRITVVLNDEQKKRWDGFAEETHSIDSTADLVRKSVEAYIGSGGDSGSQDIEGEVLGDTLAAVEDVEAAVHTVETEVKALRTENVQRDAMEGIVAEMAYLHSMDAVEELLNEYGFEISEEGDIYG